MYQLISHAAVLLAFAALALPASGHGAHSHHHPHPHDYYYPFCWWNDCHHSESEHSAYENLQGIRKASELRIVTTPSEASVFVDGERVPRRDDGFAAITLLEGVHRVQVRAPGHESADREIVVEGGGGRIVEIVLNEKP